jgi:HlyD family secretion protein
MFSSLLSRFWLPVSAFVLTAGFITRLGLTTPGLPDWASSGGRTESSAGHPNSGQVRVVAEGSVVAYPGAEVVVGCEAAGRIVILDFCEGSPVHKGDLLAALNADDLLAGLTEAEAKASEADADIRFFEREVRRDELLIARRAAAVQNLDADRRGLETASARRDAALAGQARCRALIAKTRIIAPIDGVVTARHAHQGEMVGVGQRVFTIADMSRLRIEAEVDEFDAARVTTGARAVVTAEGQIGASWSGTIEEVPDVVVTRRLRPEDPGRPIDARVLAVKVALGESTPLKLGQRVEVEFPAPGEGSGYGDDLARVH